MLRSQSRMYHLFCKKILIFVQECIPVGCVPPARYRTGRVSVRGVSLTDRDPPGHVTCGACWDREPPVNRMTDR